MVLSSCSAARRLVSLRTGSGTKNIGIARTQEIPQIMRMQSLQLWFETRQGVRLENVNTKNDLPNSVVNNDRDGAHADTKVYTSSVDRLSNTSVLRHGVVREQTHGEGNVRSHKDSEADACED